MEEKHFFVVHTFVSDEARKAKLTPPDKRDPPQKWETGETLFFLRFFLVLKGLKRSVRLRGETPAIVIEPITDEPTVSSSTYLKIDWTLRIRVVVVIRGTTPESIGDGTIESLHAKMLTDTTIGGLAKDVRPSTQTFEFIEGDQPSGVITCEYEIDYRTGYNSLTT